MKRFDSQLRPDEDDRLHFAASDGDLAEAIRLLDEGLNPNAFDVCDATPLHRAAENENFEMVDLLLARGADVNAHHEANIGDTVLRHVAATCSLKMAKRLIDAGADPTIPGWMQITALDEARRRKRGDGPAVYALLLKVAQRKAR